MHFRSKVKGLDIAGLVLMLISSTLLGIRATMNTIALRNVLLWIGFLFALVYWWNWIKINKTNHTLPSLSWLYWLPAILIGLMFIWVVIHYLFFSTNPQQQFSELKSTWLRSFLAVILGSATGAALNRNPRLMPYLWLGLLLSFIVLIYQYIPKALQLKSLFATSWSFGYIYWAKFNGVLAGILMIAGLLGLLIDSFWQNKNRDKKIQSSTHVNANLTSTFSMATDQKTLLQPNSEPVKVDFIKKIVIPIYAFVGIYIAIYAFVFIFDAKAGIGIAFILIAFWLATGLLFSLKNAVSEQDKKRRKTFLKKSLIIFY
jgi:hypothetical protein